MQKNSQHQLRAATALRIAVVFATFQCQYIDFNITAGNDKFSVVIGISVSSTHFHTHSLGVADSRDTAALGGIYIILIATLKCKGRCSWNKYK